MVTEPTLLQKLGREIARTAIGLGLYVGALAFLALAAFKFVPTLVEHVAASPVQWADIAGGDANELSTTGSRSEPAALPLHGSIAEPVLRRREPHQLPH
jgi:hypothetical protein